MTIYVAEIKGRAIAAFDVMTSLDAEHFVRDRSLRDDLMTLMTDDRPIWDGLADIDVRQALSHEEAKWRKSRAEAIRYGNIEPDDSAWVVFLVALADPGRCGRNKVTRRPAFRNQ
jgi:hypothetical protein